jgi:hypothetical protein
MKAFDYAVLDDAGLHFLRAGHWLCVPTPEASHVGDLLQHALDHNLARIWITPGSALSTSLAASEDQMSQFIADAQAANWNLWAPNDQDFISGWRAGTAKVQLAIPERSRRWTAFQACHDSTVLYAAIKYLQEALNIPLVWGPGNVGLRLIQQVNDTRRRAAYIRPSGSDLGIFMRYARQYHHTDLLWSRPLTEDERRCTWLHRYDKNNAYVGAASSANLGAGEYVYQTKPTFDEKIPGLWHILLSGESRFNGRDLPHPTSGQADSWQHSVTVKLCMELGYQVKILEALLFPEYHQTLRPWYELIAETRQKLLTPGAYKNAQAQAVAYGAIKNIYTSSLGKLAETARAASQNPLYRPDWWCGVVALSRVRILTKIAELAAVGYRPVAVHTDALYFVSHEADPLAALPGLVTQEHGIGRFKHVDSFPLADIGIEHFSPRIATLEKRLRELGAQEVEVLG